MKVINDHFTVSLLRAKVSSGECFIEEKKCATHTPAGKLFFLYFIDHCLSFFFITRIHKMTLRPPSEYSIMHVNEAYENQHAIHICFATDN